MTISTLDALQTQLESNPEIIEFADVIALIDAEFDFTPTTFVNGGLVNHPNQNNGSCKLLALADYLGLSNAQSLALFGHYYRQDVMLHPAGQDHANIRQFMLTGMKGVAFTVFPLRRKQTV